MLDIDEETSRATDSHFVLHRKERELSMDWFKGNFTGKPHIYWENLWFPVDFPLNQSIDSQIF